MTDFVYICREGFNEELRYSIRSLMQNFPDPNIWVVGGKPRWYSGNYIQVPQTNDKYTNMYENWDTILRSKQIKTNFVLMNDDFYLIKPIIKIPVYHGGNLLDKVEKYERLEPRFAYTKRLRLTYERIKALFADEPLDYDLHVPMTLNKTKLAKIFDKTETDILWRSMYGNCFAIGGEQQPDVKVYTRGAMKQSSYKPTADTVWLSTDDHSFKFKIKGIVRDKFATRSALELD
jgi:hypothetical protein